MVAVEEVLVERSVSCCEACLRSMKKQTRCGGSTLHFETGAGASRKQWYLDY